MEEYDADIQFHFIKGNDGSLHLTTDIDNQIDYLEPEERAIIIASFIGDLFEQLFSNIDNVDEDTETELYQKICSDTLEVRDTIITSIINFHYNSYAKHCEKDPKLLEFSMAIYEAMYNKIDKSQVNFIMNTTHSDNITALEPLSGSLAFTLDVAEMLLKNGVPKSVTEQVMAFMLKQNLDAVKQFIKTYKEDE